MEKITNQIEATNRKSNKNVGMNGITLIALVITIIVLLILAGVTIVTLTGQNGILTRATEAKTLTEQATIKEELTIAIANYQIAKSKNDSLTLSDFLQNTEQSSLTGLKIIEQTSKTIIGSYQERIFFIDESGDIKLSTTPNLVNNGLGENKNNSNFSQATYKEEENNFSVFHQGDYTFLNDDYIPVDSTKTYYQSLTVKSSNPNSIYYIGFQEYDEDKNLISPYHFYTILNSLTYLESDLKKGDTEVYLHDASGFVLTSSTPNWQRGFIFWNYQNNSGYQYPELTYSRNVFPFSDYSKSLFDFTDINLTNNSIHLTEPWNFAAMPKGTKVSQRSSGAMWNYGLTDKGKFPNTWTTLGNTIKGTQSAEHTNYIQFRPATKYIKFSARLNYGSSTEETTFDFKNVIFTQMD